MHHGKITRLLNGPRPVRAYLLMWVALLVETPFAWPIDPPPLPYAVYRADRGVREESGQVSRWESDPPGRPLDRVSGVPRLLRPGDGSPGSPVLHFDGESALWAAAKDWGRLAEGRTVAAYLRPYPGAEGFLFDGSTASGLCRAQVRRDGWQAGSQPASIERAGDADAPTRPAAFENWQAHAFRFEPTPNGSLRVEHHTSGTVSSAANASIAAPLAGLVLGQNARLDRGLRFELAEFRVYDRALDTVAIGHILAELEKTWGQPDVAPVKAAADPASYRSTVRTRGQDGVHTYRIPGLATATNGHLLAVFDVRHRSGADLPGDIDVGLAISTDEGRTWGPTRTILDFPSGVPGSMGNGVGDPCILVDQVSGEIFCSALWSKGNRGYRGSGPGLDPDQTGQWVMTRSRDNGQTWSPPENLTRQLKRPEWRMCFQGPGSGLQLRDGTLVFPAQIKDAANIPHSCFAYSRDHGKNWRLSPLAVPTTPPTTEAALAEMPDGSLLISMRNEAKTGRRLWSRWTWGTEPGSGTWSEPWSQLQDPTCMASLLRHPNGRIYFCNPDHTSRRLRLTLRSSADDGRNWDEGVVVEPGVAMYSSLTLLPGGDIGVLYEAGDVGGLEFARIPVEAR